MAQAKVALDMARALLDDQAGTLWTDAVLLPFLQKAHSELAAKLAAEGIPVVKTETSILSVPAYTTILNNVAGYPTDLIEPIELFERYPGESVDKFVPVVERNFIPNLLPSQRLAYWCWEGEQIKMLGAVVNTEVQLRYTRALPTPTSASSNIGFIYGELYIGPRTASLAGSSVGNNDGAAEWREQALEGLDDVLAANIRGLQNLPTRHRPYHRRRMNNRVIRGL